MYYTDPGRRRRWLPPLLTLAWCLAVAAAPARAESPSTWSYVDEAGHERTFDECADNVIDGGRIGTDARGCANPTFQPATLTNVTSPSGGSGDLEYLWMTTTSDPAGAQPVSWDIIPGSTSAEYTPNALTRTAYFMRCSRRAGCDKWAGESNYVTITIDCCDPIVDGGEIGGAPRNCGRPAAHRRRWRSIDRRSFRRPPRPDLRERTPQRRQRRDRRIAHPPERHLGGDRQLWPAR